MMGIKRSIEKKARAQQRLNSRAERNVRGSMLFLSVCLIAVIVVPLLILICKIGPLSIYTNRAESVVEAASKVAATDLSRIVINDPQFGYVALSNQPPVGKATLAADGEPLPVTGINTVIGTLRQNAIIAGELKNETMARLVDEDVACLNSTVSELNKSLNASIGEEIRKKTTADMDGKLVDPLQDVKQFLTENLPPNIEVESMKISLGWLEGGSETTVPIPQPQALSQVRKNDIQDGNYVAFTNYRVGERVCFQFAGLGSQVHLVSNSSFREQDGNRICSVVRLNCTLRTKDQTQARIVCESCCQAYTKPDAAAKGSMTLRFSGRPVPGLLSWNEFMEKGYFQDNRVTTFDVIGGDFPFEKNSKMLQDQQAPTLSTCQQFSEHFYHWLRSAHCRPRVDAVLSMVSESFRPYLNEVYTYEIQDDGSIQRKVVDGNHFTRSVVAEGQSAVMSDTRVRSGASAIILFRDNVSTLNTESSKHGGQPLAGYPLGNVEGNMNHEELAYIFSQRNAHREGLALDIEIGGTGDSTAQSDVLRMRQRTRMRRI
jgi:hypothetical protein